MTSILLVDDHASSRQPLSLLLQIATGFSVREAGTIAEAAAQLDGIDVAVVDLGLPDGNGSVLIRSIQQGNPETHVMVLTSSGDRVDAARAIIAGARGVLHKTAEFDAIVSAIQDIAVGRSIVTQQQRQDVERLQAEAHVTGTLTPRELEVIACLADGLTDKEIAVRLNIGVETVRTHLSNVFGKLGVDSRLQALTYALQHKLIATQFPGDQ